MKLAIRNTNLHIGFSTYVVLVFKVLVCLSLPISDDYYVEDEPGAIQLHSLQFPLNVVDLPSTKIETFFYPDHIQKTRPHKRHHQTHDRLPSESSNIESCCPSVKEIVEPLAGKNRSGDLVELYQTDNVKQRFYETSCDPSIVNERCRYLDRRHLANSKCEQQYSYSYALVRDYGTENDVNSGWRMDYIQLRSGCACRIHVP